VIDAPGPWGTGPFILAEGHSSLYNEIAIMRTDPFACVWLDTAQDRFVGYVTTLELAETRVTEERWSRRNGS
jgi:hypothetical protein